MDTQNLSPAILDAVMSTAASWVAKGDLAVYEAKTSGW